MSVVVTCPDCDAKLKLKAAVPAGKKVKCPRCSAAFAPVAQPPEEPTSRDDDEDDRPRRTRKKKRRAKSGKLALVLGLAIGGGMLCLLLIGAGITVALLVGSKDAYKENEAAAKEMVECLEELVAALESVKDRNTAKAGADRINRACDRMEKLADRVPKLPKLTPEQDKKLENQIMPQINSLNQRMARIAFQAGLAAQGEPSFRAAVDRLTEVGKRMQRMRK